MAFFVPPTHMIVHIQFNLLYQFWIHTEIVRDLGPLEYILNTAKHHRVHHGKLQSRLNLQDSSINYPPEYFQAQIDIAWTKTMLES